jgi:N-acetylneuraminate synthase
VGLLERLGVQRYKVGSGEITNTLLLDRIASTRKPVILSSGMSDLAELEAAYRFLQMREIDVSVLECTSTYPTPADEIRLRNIPWLRERFQCPVGLSDHSGTPWPSLGAVAMGAEVLEFHVTFDKRMFGPDASSSLTINETKKLVDGVRFLEKSLAAEPGKELSPTVARLKPIFEKTLCVTEPTKAGTPIRLEILDAKKPADQGIPASRYREVIGRRARLNLEAFQFITWEDLA